VHAPADSRRGSSTSATGAQGKCDGSPGQVRGVHLTCPCEPWGVETDTLPTGEGCLFRHRTVGRVSVSTPHGSQGTQAFKADDVASGGLPRTRRAIFWSVCAPVEAHSRRRTPVKQVENGWRRAAVAPVCMYAVSCHVCMRSGDPRAPREAFHALRGRRKVIHALQGGSSMRSKGGDPHAAREVIHTLRGS
jgi:hypothetical protein